MQTEINPSFNRNTKTNLEIKLQNDIIAFKKVLKWAKTIRNRIETSLKQLDCCESYNEPPTSQKVIHHTTTPIGKKLDETCSKNFNRGHNLKINRTNEDKYLIQPSETQTNKSSVGNKSINLKKVDIGSISVKNSQIDSANVEEIVDSILSKRLSSFFTRVDKIESKYAENHKNISIINNDLILLKTNLNELDKDVKEMVIETNNISVEVENKHIETYRELEKILNFLKTLLLSSRSYGKAKLYMRVTRR